MVDDLFAPDDEDVCDECGEPFEDCECEEDDDEDEDEIFDDEDS